METYFQSKRKLFNENLSPGGVAVVNGDDTYAARLYNEVRSSKRMAWKFSRNGGRDLRGRGRVLGRPASRRR
jgi:UDP-N-acetylmuramoyl-L-alanyl-D-glutamate--2,6-diaminopimelate ligase